MLNADKSLLLLKRLSLDRVVIAELCLLRRMVKVSGLASLRHRLLEGAL